MKRTFDNADIGEPTLKHFRPDDFHVVTGSREEIMTHEPDDQTTGKLFFSGAYGQKTVSLFKIGDNVRTEGGPAGNITGFAMDRGKFSGFARINGRLYHVRTLRKI